MRLTFTTLLTLLFAGSLWAQTFCLRLSEVSNDGNTLVVKIDMHGSAAFELGSSNLQWSYNASKISTPVLQSSNLPGVPFYEVTVSTPNPGEASLNIDLSFPDVVSTIGATWTEIAQVSFTVIDPADSGELLWLYNGGTTQTVVYLDNEATQIFATNVNCLEGILGPLPAELLSFKALPQKESVLLHWETASEDHIDGFEVQKSQDAQSWTALDWLASQGSSFTQQDYESLDEAPHEGINYYRLKILDEDGSFAYSTIESASFTKPISIKLFPNPAQDEVQLSYPAQKQLERLLIYNQVGSLQLETQVLPNGRIDLSGFSSGIYFVEVHIGQQVIREKLIVN